MLYDRDNGSDLPGADSLIQRITLAEKKGIRELGRSVIHTGKPGVMKRGRTRELSKGLVPSP
jgi:hypothetical protein